MALGVKSIVSFEIRDDRENYLFQSGHKVDQPTNLIESFAGKANVPSGAVDQSVSMMSVSVAKRLFILADKSVKVKIVCNGHGPSDTPAFTLVPEVPIFIGAMDIVGLYFTNTTTEDALVVVAGAGDN